MDDLTPRPDRHGSPRRAGGTALALCVLALHAGCLQGASRTCDNGSVCPPGKLCVDTEHTTPERVCAAGTCGNGLPDVNEICDDGNNRSGDGCPADCSQPCGDGVRDPDEVCDDGNTVDGDGCSADCRSLDGTFRVTPSMVTLAAAEGDPSPTPTTVTVYFEYRGDTVRVGYAPGVPQPTWLSIVEGPSSGTTAELEFRATDTSVAGEQSTSVRLLISHVDSTGLNTFDIPVAYRVAPSDLALQVTRSTLDFTAAVGAAAPPPELLEATFNGDSVEVEEAPPWMTVAMTSAATASPASFAVSVNSTALTPGTLSGRVVLATTRGAVRRTVSIPVTYQVLAFTQQITSLDRLAVRAGQAGTIMMYGTGFQSVTNPNTDLRIAGVTPTAVTVLSDRALSVSVPALPAGEYMVTLSGASGVVTSSKPITVLAPIDRAYEEIATEGSKFSLAWSALTQSAYVVNASLDLVMRFNLGQTPATVTAHRIANVRALGLPLDRSVLVVSDAAGALHDLDPTSLSLIRTRAAGAQLHASGSPIPISGDNLAWISSYGGIAYDLARSAPANVDSARRYACYFCAVSPNGRRMLFNQDPTVSPGPPLAWWDTVEGQLHTYATGSVGVFYQATSDRAGDRWVLDSGRVFDFNLASQGSIATPQGWVGLRYAMSRNGRRTYVFSISENAIGTYSEPDPVRIFPKIFVFDTTGPLITTTTYPLLGSFDLAAYGSCRATQGPVACSPYSLSFAMTDDERTLLAVGDRRLLVIPIPAQYRSP
jgi:cysteine-rich repeat protein